MKIPFQSLFLITFLWICLSFQHVQAKTVWDNPTDSTFISEEICPGECVIIGNDNFCEGGFYVVNLVGSDGCDSILLITIDQSLELFLTVDICEGDCFYIPEIDSTLCRDSSDILYFPYESCPEALVLFVNVVTTPIIFIDTLDICEGECFDILYTTYCPTSDTTYQFIINDVCTDTLEVHVNIIETSATDSLIYYRCSGECVEFDGGLFCNDYAATTIFTNNQGCDSLVYFELNISPTANDTFQLGICEGMCVEWEGMEFCEMTSQLDSFITDDGCDSVVVINTEILPLFPQLLPPDSTIELSDSIRFEIEYDNFSVFWNTGVDSSVFVFQAQDFGNGIHPVFATIVENSSGCLRISDTTFVQVGILENTEELSGASSRFLLFPNPIQSGDRLELIFPAIDAKELQLQIHTIQGDAVLSQIISNRQSNYHLSLDKDFLPGIYLISIQGDGHRWVKKLLVH